MEKWAVEGLSLEIQAKAIELENRINRNKDKVTAMLLGPGYPLGQLELRKEIASRLSDKGYHVVVMEAIQEWKEMSVGEKFKGILDKLNPDLFVCIFTKKGVPHGVIFEIGFICGHLGRDTAMQRLRFCVEEGVNKEELLTIYVREIMEIAKTYDYQDAEELLDIVEGLIKDEILRR
ncbi:MAG: hypothetical protein QME59_03470 [Candidatus Hydrothermarchaeota archaeon]|nr:hypothetical protein [Candidatus Hydrothermarchaeota archaeon]